MASMVTLTKDLFQLYIKTENNYARVGKSTVYELQFNPELETRDYIEDRTPTEELKNYKPTMAQEIALIQGDPAFDYLYGFLETLPTGESAKKEVLLLFPTSVTGDGETKNFKAWKTLATISLNSLNTVDKKITFNLSFANIEHGTATVSAGQPTFSAKGEPGAGGAGGAEA